MDELEQIQDTEILEDKSSDQSQKVKIENVEETVDANPALCTEVFLLQKENCLFFSKTIILVLPCPVKSYF